MKEPASDRGFFCLLSRFVARHADCYARLAPFAAVSKAAMRRFRTLLLLLSVLVLAACAGGPPKRIFPPQVSLHELKVEADGQWTAQLRIRNFSTVPMHFNRLSATLSIGAEVAGRIEVDPGLGVGPGSSELISHRFSPSPAARAAVDQALAQRR